MANTKDILAKLSSTEHMPWVPGRTGYFFQSKAVQINAKPADVWAVVKDANHYYEHSHGAVWARVDGKLQVNKRISLRLFKDTWIGKLVGQSDEYISKADDEVMTVGWERRLPIGGLTERYQVLEPSADGKTTMSYIALKVPGIVGFFTKHFLKSTIEASFNELSNGIKETVEQDFRARTV